MTLLPGQSAVVTGGASGIGRAVCLALAAEGAEVTVADVDKEGARTVAAEIESAGGRAAAARADVTASEEVEALVAGVVARSGRLDILIACAGICRVKPFLELGEDELLAMWRVHALGTFLCMRAAAPHMVERGYGRIVCLVSGPGGYGASPWTAHYQAAKSAQTSLTRSAGLTLAPHGVTVNCVSPGLVVTPLWEAMDEDFRRFRDKTARQEIADRLADPGSYPLGRAPSADEVAGAVLFFCLPGSGVITGEVLNL